jgi:3-hydroxyisobutyrate dehydrogenase-like beta-hydroxyacid dehydrogenase
MPSKRVGFVGLGRMGRPMAENLLRAGFPLTVWNRTARDLASLLEQGAQKGEGPAALAAGCDVIVTMISDTADVRQIVLEPGGILDGARRAGRSGLAVIDMSTILPAVSEEIAAALAAEGIDFLDAPVSGGPVGAEAGTLAIMVGGRREVFEHHLDVLSALGKKIVLMGPVGSGERTKLINNVVCAVTMQAICEGLVMGRRGGLDPGSVLEILSAGAAACRGIELYGPMLVSDGHQDARFSLKLMHKDLGLALETARSLGTPLPATVTTREVFDAARGLGLDEHNFSAIVKVLEQQAGVIVGESTAGDALT